MNVLSIQKSLVILEFCDSSVIIGFGGDSSPLMVVPALFDTVPDDTLQIRLFLINLLRKIFYDCLFVKTKTIKVLVIESLLWPKLWRDCLFTTLLVDFQVQAVSFQPNLIMSHLTSGSKCNLVVNIGEKKSEVICIEENRPIVTSHRIIDIGWSIVASKDMLDKWIGNNNESIALDTLCYGNDQAEIGLSESILDSILSCSVDSRGRLASNVLFCGEGSKNRHIITAVCTAVTSLTQITSSNNKYAMMGSIIKSLPNSCMSPKKIPFHGPYLAWIGGSIFITSNASEKKFVKKESMSEWGNIPTNFSEENAFSCCLTAPDWLSLTEKDWTFFAPAICK